MFLEHVNMTVADLDRSIAFYGDLLGFRVRWRGHEEADTFAGRIRLENQDGNALTAVEVLPVGASNKATVSRENGWFTWTASSGLALLQ